MNNEYDCLVTENKKPNNIIVLSSQNNQSLKDIEIENDKKRRLEPLKPMSLIQLNQQKIDEKKS